MLCFVAKGVVQHFEGVGAHRQTDTFFFYWNPSIKYCSWYSMVKIGYFSEHYNGIILRTIALRLEAGVNGCTWEISLYVRCFLLAGCTNDEVRFDWIWNLSECEEPNQLAATLSSHLSHGFQLFMEQKHFTCCIDADRWTLPQLEERVECSENVLFVK